MVPLGDNFIGEGERITKLIGATCENGRNGS